MSSVFTVACRPEHDQTQEIQEAWDKHRVIALASDVGQKFRTSRTLLQPNGGKLYGFGAAIACSNADIPVIINGIERNGRTTLYYNQLIQDLTLERPAPTRGKPGSMVPLILGGSGNVRVYQSAIKRVRGKFGGYKLGDSRKSCVFHHNFDHMWFTGHSGLFFDGGHDIPGGLTHLSFNHVWGSHAHKWEEPCKEGYDRTTGGGTAYLMGINYVTGNISADHCYGAVKLEMCYSGQLHVALEQCHIELGRGYGLSALNITPLSTVDVQGYFVNNNFIIRNALGEKGSYIRNSGTGNARVGKRGKNKFKTKLDAAKRLVKAQEFEYNPTQFRLVA